MTNYSNDFKHQTSPQIDTDSLQAQATDQIAAGLNHAAQALRTADLDAATSKVTTFARENPVLFIGGAALLGFAAARFLKSSDAGPAPKPAPVEDPWTGHVTATPVTPDLQETDRVAS